jgi:hypothetical protein
VLAAQARVHPARREQVLDDPAAGRVHLPSLADEAGERVEPQDAALDQQRLGDPRPAADVVRGVEPPQGPLRVGDLAARTGFPVAREARHRLRELDPELVERRFEPVQVAGDPRPLPHDGEPAPVGGLQAGHAHPDERAGPPPLLGDRGDRARRGLDPQPRLGPLEAARRNLSALERQELRRHRHGAEAARAARRGSTRSPARARARTPRGPRRTAEAGARPRAP